MYNNLVVYYRYLFVIRNNCFLSLFSSIIILDVMCDDQEGEGDGDNDNYEELLIAKMYTEYGW